MAILKIQKTESCLALSLLMTMLTVVGCSNKPPIRKPKFNLLKIEKSHKEVNTVTALKGESASDIAKKIYGSSDKIQLIKKMNPGIDFSKPIEGKKLNVNYVAPKIEPKVATEDRVVNSSGGSAKYVIQTGTFRSKKNAVAEQERLGAAGFNLILKTVYDETPNLFVVRTQPIDDFAEAKKQAELMKVHLPEGYWVRNHK